MRARRGHRRVRVKKGKPGGALRMRGAPVEFSKTEVEVAQSAADGDQPEIVGRAAERLRLLLNGRQRSRHFGQLRIAPRSPLLFQRAGAGFIARQQRGVQQPITQRLARKAQPACLAVCRQQLARGALVKVFADHPAVVQT